MEVLAAYSHSVQATDAKIQVFGRSRGTGIFASHGEPSGGLYVADLRLCHTAALTSPVCPETEREASVKPARPTL